MKPKQFISWKKGETRSIEVGKSKKLKGRASHKTTWSLHGVPAVYHWLVCQLVDEDQHRQNHPSHESCRCQMYARRILDLFMEEIKGRKVAPAEFQSVILTPILQQQLAGVHNAYTPSVRSAIGRRKEKPTILNLTNIYLSRDPTDPTLIPTFCRNLVYIAEARWHLGVVLDRANWGTTCTMTW
jgi:hypothetical protein